MTTRKEVTIADIFELARRNAEAERGDKQAKPSAKYLARAKAELPHAALEGQDRRDRRRLHT